MIFENVLYIADAL